MCSTDKTKKNKTISLRQMIVGTRPKVESWDGPHFRLSACGVDYGRELWKPHALFMDAIDSEGTWLYLISGTLFYKLGTKRHLVAPGQALILRHPDRGSLIRPGGEIPLQAIWLNVSGEPALRIFDFLHSKYGQLQPLSLHGEAVRRAQQLVRLVVAQPKLSAHVWSEKTFLWLNAWWREISEQKLVPQVQIDATNPSKLLAYGAHNFKEFAEQMGYSRSHLTRKLSHQWRNTPGKIFREARLSEAARLLRTTEQSIGEIATLAGYSTTAAFSRAFTSHYAESPRAYRQSPLARKAMKNLASHHE